MEERTLPKISDIAEIQKTGAELFANERQGAAGRKETTPAAINDDISRFCATLGSSPLYIPVVNDPDGIYGFCSDGVELKIAKSGGRIVFGWCIWEWPGVFLTAEFHSVWESPTAEMLDITPKPGAETRILFVPDQTYPQDFDFDKRPGNRRRRTFPTPDTAELLARKKANLRDSQLEYEERRARNAGLSLDEWLSSKIPTDPLPALIDDFLAACNAHEEYFDKLGVSGTIAVDKTLYTLMRRRHRLQLQLKEMLRTRRL